MRQDWSDPDREPSPEELAAFADGELEAPGRERMEAWLAEHPKAAEQVDGLRRLMQLCQKTAPADPSPAAWATTFARIEAAFPRGPSRPSRRRWPYTLVAGLSVAAAVLGAVLLTRSLRLPAPEEAQDDLGEEPFPVATAQEINIIHMDAADADALAVGHPPILGSFDLAKPADVNLVKVEPAHPDGPLPWLEEGEVPMIVDPVALVGGRQP
jgi:anti-sigma factor RsiW